MAIDCLCIGILFADYICAPIERIPGPGDLVPTDSLHLTVGGCASNAALDLAKLGVSVGASGCVGDDPFGRVILETLQRGGVQIDGIHRIADRGTASTMVINVRGEDRRFISAPGANAIFSVDHIPTDWVEQAKVIYVGGYLMMPALETEAFVDLFRCARAAGTKMVVDVVLLGGERSLEKLGAILPETDVFLPNGDEAVALLGETDPLRQAERFREMGAGTVVITRGHDGALLLNDSHRLRAGVYPTELVGATGSGDAFDAGYCTGMLLGEDPAGCLRWGSALGASCIRALGATESVFSREEAEAFMREHELQIEEF